MEDVGEVVRFAPSPTGYLHLGHAYSAWFVQQVEGRHLLRIEDINRERVREEYLAGIFEDMEWLGFEWDGEVVYQSQRKGVYLEALEKLKGIGVVYPCFCSRKEVERMGGGIHADFGAIYGGACRGMGAGEVEEKMAGAERWNWRLDLGACRERFGELKWFDRDAGWQVAEPELGGDPVVANFEGALYHLSVVVDDAEQGISVVTRGRDVFMLTHVHRVLQEALGVEVPEYWHHGVVMGEDGSKLSKRYGALGLRELRERGMSGAEAIYKALAHLEG